MLYDRFAENPAIRQQHQQRLRESFLPDLDYSLEQPFRQQEFLAYAAEHALHLTPNLLQSYLRLDLLPRPILRRYFSRQHLALFNILDRLRELLEVWEIRQLLKPLHEQTSFSSQDITVAEWFYAHLRREVWYGDSGDNAIDGTERLRFRLVPLISEAVELREAQRLQLLASLEDLKDLCEALEVARRQFLLRRSLERHWRERRTVRLSTIGKEVNILPAANEMGHSQSKIIRVKQIRRRKS